MPWRSVHRFGLAPALLVVGLDLLASACGGDDEAPGPRPETSRGVEAALPLARCEPGTKASAQLSVRHRYTYRSYECQLGMCSRGSCNEENAYKTYENEATAALSYQVVSATCEPGCTVEIGAEGAEGERSVAVVRGSPGVSKVALTIHVELPAGAGGEPLAGGRGPPAFARGSTVGEYVYRETLTFGGSCGATFDAGSDATTDAAGDGASDAGGDGSLVDASDAGGD